MSQTINSGLTLKDILNASPLVQRVMAEAFMKGDTKINAKGKTVRVEDSTIAYMNPLSFEEEEIKLSSVMSAVNTLKKAKASLPSGGKAEAVLNPVALAIACQDKPYDIVESPYQTYAIAPVSNKKYCSYAHAESMNGVKQKVSNDKLRARLAKKYEERKALKEATPIREWTVQKPFGYNDNDE